MQRINLSVKQYRNLDLSFWAVLMVVFEIISFKAATKWYPDQLYTVSLVPALVTIIFMRWDYFGLIHALLGGFVYSYLAEGTVLQFMCYLGGNLFCVLAVLLLRAIGKDSVRDNVALSVLFAFAVAFCMQCGRAVICLVLGFSFGESIGFITTDILSGVFAIVVVLIARKLDGVYEDQKVYLSRVHEELEKEQGSNR